MQPEYFSGDGKSQRQLHELAIDSDGSDCGGFVEGIALDPNGHVSEGSGENVFVVWKGKVYTPNLASSILSGITRDTVITLAKIWDFKSVKNAIPRELLYIAEEVFLTGSAAEITPVRSIDKITDRKRPSWSDNRNNSK